MDEYDESAAILSLKSGSRSAEICLEQRLLRPAWIRGHPTLCGHKKGSVVHMKVLRPSSNGEGQDNGQEVHERELQIVPLQEPQASSSEAQPATSIIALSSGRSQENMSLIMPQMPPQKVEHLLFDFSSANLGRSRHRVSQAELSQGTFGQVHDDVHIGREAVDEAVLVRQILRRSHAMCIDFY